MRKKVFDIEPWTDWTASGEKQRVTKVVLIGKGVDKHRTWLGDRFDNIT